AGDPFTIRIHFSCTERISHPVFSAAIYSSMGAPVFAIHTSDTNAHIPALEKPGFIDLKIEHQNLMPATYLLHFALGDEYDPHRFDHRINAGELVVEPRDVYRSGRLRSAAWTLVYFNCTWRTEGIENVENQRDTPVESLRELL